MGSKFDKMVDKMSTGGRPVTDPPGKKKGKKGKKGGAAKKANPFGGKKAPPFGGSGGGNSATRMAPSGVRAPGSNFGTGTPDPDEDEMGGGSQY